MLTLELSHIPELIKLHDYMIGNFTDVNNIEKNITYLTRTLTSL